MGKRQLPRVPSGQIFRRSSEHVFRCRGRSSSNSLMMLETVARPIMAQAVASAESGSIRDLCPFSVRFDQFADAFVKPTIHAGNRLADFGVVGLRQRREYHPIEAEFSLVLGFVSDHHFGGLLRGWSPRQDLGPTFACFWNMSSMAARNMAFLSRHKR